MSCTPWTPPHLPPPSFPYPKKRPSSPLSFSAAASSSSSPSPLPHLLLHDSLDAAGIDTLHARAARAGFCRQAQRMTGAGAEASIAISLGADLARAALHVAAEDDSLVSHSSVPLPVDAFVARLDELGMGFCSTFMPPAGAPPELFLANLERYFYVHKGFRRTDAVSDTRALYLHSALTCRSGSVLMLTLIYSEMLKMLRVCGALDFDAEIFFPHDHISLPRGYDKLKSKSSDEPHTMTSKALLVKILTSLKDAFWPFQYDRASSLFLRAAHAANHIYGPGGLDESSSMSKSNVSALEIASAKAAQHRLGRGVWTNVRFGDMRRALAACERLVLLDNNNHQQLRDYAVLLYHCGFYRDCLQCLTSYQASVKSDSQTSPVDLVENDAVKNLIARVNLILAEDGWNKRASNTNYWSGTYREPW